MAEKTRSVAEIRADLARDRARVANSVQNLATEVNPKNVAKRSLDDARGFVSAEFSAAKSQVKDDDGWRMDRLMVIGGAVLGVVAFVVTLNSIANHRTRSVQAKVRKAVEQARREA